MNKQEISLQAFYGMHPALWTFMMDKGCPAWRSEGCMSSPVQAEQWISLMTDAEIQRGLAASTLGLDAEHIQVDVNVDLVDPTEGFVGGDDISCAVAQLDLNSGAITLENPKSGWPLLNWSDLGISIRHEGVLFHAHLLESNVPCEFQGEEIVRYIQEQGYSARIDLATLVLSGTGSECSDCGTGTDHVVGCTDGAEVCQQCFDSGCH